MTALIVVLTMAVAGMILILLFSRITGVVPMPSSNRERDAVIAALKDYAHIKRITDLGSGWGGLVRHLAIPLADREIRAVEQSPFPFWFSKIATLFMGYRNITHERRNFHSLKLESGEAYVCYLSGPAMKDLRTQFERDLPKKGILISIAFAMPGWTPVKKEEAGNLIHSPVYVYEY